MGRIMCAKSRCGPISEYVASDDAHGLAGAFTASVNLGASTLAGYCSAFATISLSFLVPSLSPPRTSQQPTTPPWASRRANSRRNSLRISRNTPTVRVFHRPKP